MYGFYCSDSYHISSPEGAYVYDIIATLSGLAVISSDDALRLLNPLRLGDQLKTFKNVHAGVTCLKSLNEEGSLLCTAGRDGVFKIWDVESGKTVREGVSNPIATILSLAVSQPNCLAAGTELDNHQASIFMWDMWNLQEPVIQYVESHSDDITELQFHPTQPNILLSGSTDGLVNIYNTTLVDEEEALQQVINHGHSIHHANFLNQSDVFALSHDEKFSIYELASNPEMNVEEKQPTHYGDMRENLGGEYVANVLARFDGGAVMGVGRHSEEDFDLVHLKKMEDGGWAFEPETKVALQGAHGGEVVRSFCFLDAHNLVFTAGEDGRVKAWGARDRD